MLKALKSPSKSIKDFKEYDVYRPWNSISKFTAPLPVPESFEVYPNRDSIPFIEQYHFDPSWRIKEFVRGTLRLNGWAKAWNPVFQELQTLTGRNDDARIEEMSQRFWRENKYDQNEPDRVVLCVGLKADRGRKTMWHKTSIFKSYEAQELGKCYF